MNIHSQAAPPAPPGAYHIGDRDDRPWGHYVVTGAGTDGAGEEYCDKVIVVKPAQALSLQSHDLRRETWRVKQGTLTVVLDGKRLRVVPGQSLDIPQGSIHCMANLDETDCIVEERQAGVCREEDIKRYADAYNRATEASVSPAAARSAAIYNAILAEIRKMGERGKKRA